MEISTNPIEGQSEGGEKVCQISDKPFKPVEYITPIDTKKEIAKKAGVSHDTIAKVKKIAEKADEGTKAKLRSGETTIKEYRDKKEEMEEDETLVEIFPQGFDKNDDKKTAEKSRDKAARRCVNCFRIGERQD